MLDYQLIPIIVFVVLLIPPIIFAFFRGWKATLVITLVTFALFGIVVGISFAIYDVAIWSVYRDLFIDVPQGLDPDAMSNASKPSAIILVVGVSSPIIYGLTMGLYKPFKKLLARHLEPKTTKIDKNSKTVSRTSNVVSRTSGVLIASVASLFVASTIASAASTVSTKYSKNNGFNKFLSSVGSIYTMGQGHYDEPFMILQDFAKNDLKGPEIQALYSLLALGDKRIDSSSVASINVPSIRASIQNIAKGDNSFLSLVRLVYSKSGGSKVDVLNEFEGTHAGVLGLPREDGLYGTALQDRKAAAYHFGASSDAVSTISKYLRDNRFKSFEESNFYKDWKTSLDLVTSLRKELARRITKLNFDNSEITRLDALVIELTTTISGLTSRINDLGSKTIPSSFINAASIKEITANGELTTATTEYNGALNDFQTKNNEFLKRDQDVMTAQNAFDTATRELSSLRTMSSDLALKIINHKTLIQTFASRIAKIPSLILTSQTLKNQLTTKLSKATNDKNALKPITDVHGEQLAMNHAKVLYDANLVSISTKASEVGTATSEATQAQREYDALKSNKDSLQLQLSSLTAGTPQYNSINLKLQKVKVKVAEKKTELDKKTNQLNALKQEERRLGALTQSLKSAFDNAKAAYDKVVIDKAAYERKNQDLWNKIYDYNQKITIETNKIDSLNKELNNSKQSKANEEASLLNDQTQKNNIDNTGIPEKQTEITRLLATLNRNKQSRDNYKNTVLNPAITIMDQKQIIKDDKENIHNTKLDELNKLINEKTTKKALKIQKTNELDAAKKLLVDTHADKDMLSKPSDITKPIIDQNLSKEDQGKKFAEWADNNPEPTSIAGLSDYITAMKNATNLKQVIRDIKKKEYSILINKYLHVVEETLKG